MTGYSKELETKLQKVKEDLELLLKRWDEVDAQHTTSYQIVHKALEKIKYIKVQKKEADK